MLSLSYIQSLTKFINSNPCIDFDARTNVLYPLLDQIYNDGEILQLELESGLKLEYLYKSNIAKEILLRENSRPTHAWEPMTSQAIQFAMEYRPGSALIGGAYFGDHALLAANAIRNTSDESKIICIEPNSEQRQMLEVNAKNNNLGHKFKTYSNVLWKESGIKFNLNDSDSHACVVQSPNANLISRTIDEILEENNVQSLSALLLDIEGSEEQALQGAYNILNKDKSSSPVLIIEVHRNYVDWTHGLHNTTIVKYLAELGYIVFALRDAQSNWELALNAPEIIPADSVYLEGPPHGFNLIAAKSMDFFEANNFSIVRHVSPKYLRHRNPKLHLPLVSIR